MIIKTHESALREIAGAAVKGDAFTRLGFLIMGAGCAARGQFIKGALFLFSQFTYLLFMINFGAGYLAKFPSLGTVEQSSVWDDSLGFNRVIPGDNSMRILLFGILTLAVTALFLYIYIVSIRMGYQALKLSRAGLRVPSFRDDLNVLWYDKYHVVLLTVPYIGLIAFTVLPLIFMMAMAFTNYDKLHQPPGNLFSWIGFDNFKEIFWSNPLKSKTFFGLLRWTLVWAFTATFTCYFGGMALAILINKKGIKFKKMWRSLFVVTIAVPQFVSLLLMRQLLNDNGTLNMLLMNWGWISEPIKFLSSDLARVSVLVVNFWIGVPYSMLITTGILMNIPADLYESARIDGAGPFLIFRKITMPYVLFVTAPYLITRVVGDINNFNVIYLLTAGNPQSLDYYQAGKTDLLITWLYKQTVNEQNYNLASTIGIVIFAIVSVLSLLSFNLFASGKKEGDFS